MFIYSLCLFVVLGAFVLTEPAVTEAAEGPRNPEQPLCAFIESAARRTGLEAEAGARLQDAEITPARLFGSSLALFSEQASFTGNPSPIAARKLFESFLVDWLFFEDLAPQQRDLISGLLNRCQIGGNKPALAASVFSQFNGSQRATFVGITHAMLNTRLTGTGEGEDLGDALQLVEEVLDIQGENGALPSDHQFQMLVRLAPGAGEKLDRAAHFEKGENHVFHKDYPLSYRQFRRIGLHGKEAGLHFCLTRDRRLAQIHIDYRFGLLHLGPANSDVRANGNHQRHVDRWPQFRLAQKRVQVRRAVLESD